MHKIQCTNVPSLRLLRRSQAYRRCQPQQLSINYTAVITSHPQCLALVKLEGSVEVLVLGATVVGSAVSSSSDDSRAFFVGRLVAVFVDDAYSVSSVASDKTGGIMIGDKSAPSAGAFVGFDALTPQVTMHASCPVVFSGIEN